MLLENSSTKKYVEIKISREGRERENIRFIKMLFIIFFTAMVVFVSRLIRISLSVFGVRRLSCSRIEATALNITRFYSGE